MPTDNAGSNAVLDGGRDGAAPAPPPPSIATCTGRTGSATVRSWPGWAAEQLREALTIADRAGEPSRLAGVLYDEWFCRPVGRSADPRRAARPLAGLYRAAHAGGGSRRGADAPGGSDTDTVRRHDVIGADGWWRTWDEHWTPSRSRRGSARLLLTPRPDSVAALVRIVTGALLDAAHPWLLACATDPRRLRRTGSIVLDVPDVDLLPDGLLEALAPHLLACLPPLCLPIAPGVAVAEFPDNGMTFGEHRCHLVALALRRRAARSNNEATPPDVLDGVAEVFLRHGLDPARPWAAR